MNQTIVSPELMFNVVRAIKRGFGYSDLISAGYSHETISAAYRIIRYVEACRNG